MLKCSDTILESGQEQRNFTEGNDMIQLVFKVMQVAQRESTALRTDARWAGGRGWGVFGACCTIQDMGRVCNGRVLSGELKENPEGGSTVWTQIREPRWKRQDLMSKPRSGMEKRSSDEGARVSSSEPRGGTHNVNRDRGHEERNSSEGKITSSFLERFL